MNASSQADNPTDFPDEAASFLLAGPVGVLEVATDLPDTEVRQEAVAVICHPHSQHGGSMHNKVVTMLERALRELGLATVRFNFRGVGSSTGEYADGDGERDDLAAIAEWVRKVRPEAKLWLAGFSFGSYVAWRSANALDAAALITVAPPVGRWEFAEESAPTCPWLVIQGEADEVVDAEAVFAWVAGFDPGPTLVKMPETSHFFHRRLMDLRGAVKNAVRGWLPASR